MTGCRTKLARRLKRVFCKRTCMDCRHLEVEAPWFKGSEVTPPDEYVFECTKGHFGDVLFADDRHYAVKDLDLRRAQRCPDFAPSNP